MLSVKQKTILQTKPDNQEMRVGSFVIFRCTAKADITQLRKIIAKKQLGMLLHKSE